jgi:tetratricopeptide (TPR) repeat protein
MLSKELLQPLEQIRQMWARDQLEEAYLRYEGLLQEYPEHPVILREYGRAILAENGDLEKSAMLFERALEQEPDSVITLQCLSILYSWGYGRGYPAGMPLYCRLIELAPTNKQICVAAYLGVGMMRGSPGCSVSKEESGDAFQKAIEIDPECVAAWENVATLSCELQNWSDARMAAAQAENLCRQQGLPGAYAQKLLEHIVRQEPLKSRKYSPGPSPWFHWQNTPIE